MKRRLVGWSVGITLAVLTGLGVCMAQDMPPEPPPPPHGGSIHVGPGGPGGHGTAGERVWVDRDVEFGEPGNRIFFNHRVGPFGLRLGVQLEDLTNEKARELKLPGEYGVVVKEVEADSAAAKSGIAKDDVIVEFAGEKVRGATQLRRLVQETPAGREVMIQVVRAGQSKTLKATLQTPKGPAAGIGFTAPFERALPAPPEPPQTMEFFDFDVPDVDVLMYKPAGILGVSGEDLTRQLADYFGVKQGKGVLIREVIAGGAAEKAGLKAGDVIVKVNETEIGLLPDLRRALMKAGGAKQQVTLTIVRDRREQTVSVELEAPKPPRPRQSAEMPMAPAV